MSYDDGEEEAVEEDTESFDRSFPELSNAAAGPDGVEGYAGRGFWQQDRGYDYWAFGKMTFVELCEEFQREIWDRRSRHVDP
jgi:hypothetical protein